MNTRSKSKNQDDNNSKKSINIKKDDKQNNTNDDKLKKYKEKPSNIIFDEEIDEKQLDDRGNIKDLIDYSDEQDYKIYEEEMKRREDIINTILSHKDNLDDEQNINEDDNDENNKNGKILLIYPLIIEDEDDDDEEDDNEDDDDEEDDNEEDVDDDEEDDEEESTEVLEEDNNEEEESTEVLEDETTSPQTPENKKTYNTRTRDGTIKRKREDDEDDSPNKKRNIQQLHNPGDFLNMLLGGGSNNKKTQLKERVIKSQIPQKYKQPVIERIEHMDNDKYKEMQWVESLLKIPFGKYAKIPVHTKSSKETIENFFKKTINVLDESVYGLQTVKEEIINYIAQFISTEDKSMPRVIALQGSAGVGKTQIVRNGLSKALDRPMKCISMGGLRDSSHFLGFDYTYSGS